MYSEVCVLPKQNEKVGNKREFAMNVIYVGHKPTTRNEQIQRNWMIELQTYEESSDEESDESLQEQEQLRRSPRKKQQAAASAASPALRRSPRKKKNQKQPEKIRNPQKKHRKKTFWLCFK